LVHSTI